MSPHSEECAISLSMKNANPTTARIVIVSDQDSVRPMHLFGRIYDHDYCFRLPTSGLAPL